MKQGVLNVQLYHTGNMSIDFKSYAFAVLRRGLHMKNKVYEQCHVLPLLDGLESQSSGVGYLQNMVEPPTLMHCKKRHK